jgi:pantothenate kinase type III
MTLLVDVGNTRVKWRWMEGPNGVPLDGVLPLQALNTATLAEQFAAGWAGTARQPRRSWSRLARCGRQR